MGCPSRNISSVQGHPEPELLLEVQLVSDVALDSSVDRLSLLVGGKILLNDSSELSES